MCRFEVPTRVEEIEHEEENHVHDLISGQGEYDLIEFAVLLPVKVAC
jgi:hypothetical protein